MSISRLNIRTVIVMMYLTALAACTIALATGAYWSYFVGVSFSVIAAIVHLAESLAGEGDRDRDRDGER